LIHSRVDAGCRKLAITEKLHECFGTLDALDKNDHLVELLKKVKLIAHEKGRET
jgi:hypothetical protein